MKINLDKLNKAKAKLDVLTDALAAKGQKYTDVEISCFWQDGDGFVFCWEDNNAPVEEFFRIAKRGHKLTEEDLYSIAI